MNIVVVAQEAAGIQTIRLVEKSPHHLAAVLTGSEHDETDGRGVTVPSVARGLDVPVLPAASVRDPAFADELRRQDVDVLLNVHSLYLTNHDVLATPRVGSFNLHPGPLPEYAGLNVPSWAIYNGEAEHGVTLHWMAPRVDAGPITFNATFPITPRDTGVSVSAKAVQYGMPLISELLACLSGDPATILNIEQDMTRRQYFGKEVPHRGWIPWQCSAKQVLDFVRACDYAPCRHRGNCHEKAIGTGTKIEIERVHRTGEPTSAPPGTVGRSESGCVPVAAEDEWILISRARVDGTSVPPVTVLTAGDFLEAG